MPSQLHKQSNSVDFSDLKTRSMVSLEFDGQFHSYGLKIHRPIYFDSCIFNDTLKLSELEFYSNISFENCVFKKNVEITDTLFNEKLIIKGNNFTESLMLSDNKIADLILENNECKELMFLGEIENSKKQTGYLNFKGGHYQKINFSSKKIDGSIIFEEGNFDLIIFKKAIVNSAFTINHEQCKIDNLSISSTTFNDRVDLINCNIVSWLLIHGCSFNDRFLVRYGCSVNHFDLSYVECKNQVSITYDGNIDSFDISNSNFTKSLECSYSEYSREPHNTEKSLSLNISGIIQGNLVFENIAIGSIDISCINFGNMVFNNLKTRLIHLTDFQNHNKLVISNNNLNPQFNSLIIVNSNVNKTEFVNIDFRKFNDIVIAKSEVSNILLSNSIIPTRIELKTHSSKYGYGTTSEEDSNANTYFRETYRQLKIAMNNQGNQYASLLYKSKEMHYLRKELKWGTDKLLLLLNHWSNNHGISWTRGVIFTLSTAFVFFLLYNVSLANPYFCLDTKSNLQQTLNAFKIGSNEFFNFLISFPTLKISQSDKQTTLSYIVILLSRIFIGYGIYQTIVAFRKYSGK